MSACRSCNGTGDELGSLLSKMMITLGSAASMGFGVWHFFVPTLWSWYSYIDPAATELVLAVRAINVFFSLCLLLFGLINLLIVYGPGTSKYVTAVILGANCVLWTTRVVMQLAYPQGSASAVLQYGMLLSFIAVLACYASSLVMTLVAGR